MVRFRLVPNYTQIVRTKLIFEVSSLWESSRLQILQKEGVVLSMQQILNR